MATRRTTTTTTTTAKVELPLPNGTLQSPPVMKQQQQQSTPLASDSPVASSATSPFLPTVLEAGLLALYPTTLLLGSIFSTLHPATRNAPYLAHAQAYDPRQAPSYFAKKSNLFNVYFVKIGWFWVTAAVLLRVISLPAASRTRRRRRLLQALLRYGCVTATWFAVTQWFFGPAIIDRSFRWTGGKCAAVEAGTDVEAMARAGEFADVFTHAACKAIGGQWRGGHDISGHVFLLILGSAMLWLELLPALLRMQGVREARRILTRDGRVQEATCEADGDEGRETGGLGVGGQASLLVAGLSWWMLLMTAAYFHTWFEKLTGLLLAFTTLYLVYFLPRAVPALRQIVGMPGI